jgi:predicted RNA-binding protein with PIN domain
MARKRIWIVDGHNVIFAVGALQRLQVSERGAEARALLADRLAEFALARAEAVLLVFDGSGMTTSPPAARRSHLEMVYAGRGEGGRRDEEDRRGGGAADRFILREAGRRLERGEVVTVVSNDVSTLASRLPRGARHLRVRDFWLKHLEPEEGDGGKRVEGDFSDVERDLLAAAAEAGTRSAGRGRESARERPGGETAAQAAAPGHSRAAAETADERIDRKRERGRQRQERRLERRARPAGRR